MMTTTTAIPTSRLLNRDWTFTDGVLALYICSRSLDGKQSSYSCSRSSASGYTINSPKQTRNTERQTQTISAESRHNFIQAVKCFDIILQFGGRPLSRIWSLSPAEILHTFTPLQYVFLQPGYHFLMYGITTWIECTFQIVGWCCCYYILQQCKIGLSSCFTNCLIDKLYSWFIIFLYILDRKCFSAIVVSILTPKLFIRICFILFT